MECRPVEIKLISATGIKDVNTISKMDVYVVVSVSGDPRSIQRSPIDKDGGIHPRWHNYEMKFVVDEAAAQSSRIGFVFQIMSNRTLGDKEAGRVYIPVKELLDHFDSSEHKEVEYQVQTPTGRLKGTFRFSYRIGEKFKKSGLLEDPKLPMEYPPGLPMVYSPSSQAAVCPVVVACPHDQNGCPASVALPDGNSSNGGGRSSFQGVGIGLLGGLLVGEMVDEVSEGQIQGGYS